MCDEYSDKREPVSTRILAIFAWLIACFAQGRGKVVAAKLQKLLPSLECFSCDVAVDASVAVSSEAADDSQRLVQELSVRSLDFSACSPCFCWLFCWCCACYRY